MEVMMLEVIASIELEMVAIMMLVILVMTIPDEMKVRMFKNIIGKYLVKVER